MPWPRGVIGRSTSRTVIGHGRSYPRNGRPVPHRRLRRVGAPRRRRGLRADVRRRAGELGRRAPGPLRARAICGTALALEHNGDVYSCDHFVEPGHLLGNIGERHLGELADSGAQRRFGLDKRDTLPAYCRSCDVRWRVTGAAPKTGSWRLPTADRASTTSARLQGLLPSRTGTDAGDDRTARGRPSASRDHGRLRRPRRTTRPQRPLHLRRRTQMEALPRRHLAADGPHRRVRSQPDDQPHSRR